jgi:hypothetical protein
MLVVPGGLILAPRTSVDAACGDECDGEREREAGCFHRAQCSRANDARHAVRPRIAPHWDQLV